MRTWIERVPIDKKIGGRDDPHLDRWKAMIADGWAMTVLIDSATETLIALGFHLGFGATKKGRP